MTERIDLDELETDDTPDEDAPPRGAWFWEGEGTPDEEADPWSTGSLDDATDASGDAADADAADADGGADDSTDGTDGHTPVPRVPRTNDDRPVGIPMESGGSGGTTADERPDGNAATDESVSEGDTAESPHAPGAASARTTTDGSTPAADTEAGPSPDAGAMADSRAASGPHGGGADEMTLAFTYNAITRLSHLHGALADAEGWTDWIGIVGNVEAYVINKFQRDNHLDLDFFNGSGTSPADRLAAIDEHSMFYADRMVLVGVAGEDEAIADEAGWEFVPLEDAAAKAGWELDA